MRFIPWRVEKGSNKPFKKGKRRRKEVKPGEIRKLASANVCCIHIPADVKIIPLLVLMVAIVIDLRTIPQSGANSPRWNHGWKKSSHRMVRNQPTWGRISGVFVWRFPRIWGDPGQLSVLLFLPRHLVKLSGRQCKGWHGVSWWLTLRTIMRAFIRNPLSRVLDSPFFFFLVRLKRRSG